jgi:hypothetical protein
MAVEPHHARPMTVDNIKPVAATGDFNVIYIDDTKGNGLI